MTQMRQSESPLSLSELWPAREAFPMSERRRTGPQMSLAYHHPLISSSRSPTKIHMAPSKKVSKSSVKSSERKKVVLAYSGGLDTSVAIRWLQEKYDVDVIAVGGRRGPARPGRGGDRARIHHRCRESVRRGRQEGVRRVLRVQGVESKRDVHGLLSDGHLDRKAAHRQDPGGRREEGEGPLHRPRLHRQGQRPGPLRRLHRGTGTGAGDHRAHA